MDSDWLPSRKLNLSEAASFALLVAVGRDAKFLRDVGLMDYSLLLGIHNVTERRGLPTRATPPASGQLDSIISATEYHTGPQTFSPTTLEGPGLYRAGIIDLLQRWTWSKRAERFLKIIFKLYCQTRDMAVRIAHHKQTSSPPHSVQPNWCVHYPTMADSGSVLLHPVL
mmetsp:Transcript_10328/g.23638  ORF Transcript_10328/g.23638 Transcript_10328/m.23638 type:complete len:169 (+) Transcript_10328:2535-3041(+)